jgi:exopolysaccharide biosynthesis polyprenyl glycosylphosphotransferase
MIDLFRLHTPRSIWLMLALETALVAVCYLTPCLWLIEQSINLFLLYDDGIARVAIVVGSVILGLYYNDCYAEVRIRSRIALMQQVCMVIGVTFLVQGLIAYVSDQYRMPRRAMIVGSLACLIVLPLWRIFYSILTLRVFGAERVLFVGVTGLTVRMANELFEHPEYTLRPVGFVTSGGEEETGREAPAPVLGELKDLPEVAQEHQAQRVVLGLGPGAAPAELLLMLRRVQKGRVVEDVGTLYESVLGRLSLERLEEAQLPAHPGLEPNRWKTTVQWLFSSAVAVAGLALTSPAIGVAAILVRLTSKGPVLFRQTRVGQHGAAFTLYKFRSMYVDAEAQTGAVWATENDPRVTPAGRWLRRLRIDELPQLYNVLRGDMSLVGPRPERPEFVKILVEKIPYYAHRHTVKPGVTGWAQVNYKYGNTIEDTATKLEYDLYYIKNVSLTLDLVIMFHTIKIVLLSRGAR